MKLAISVLAVLFPSCASVPVVSLADARDAVAVARQVQAQACVLVHDKPAACEAATKVLVDAERVLKAAQAAQKVLDDSEVSK